MAQMIPGIVIFLMLLDMAMSVDYRDLWRVRHERSLVFRTVLSVLVLVPLFVVGLSFIVAIPVTTRVALALLASAPGAPLASKRAAGLGSRLATAMALQLIVANIGVFTAPFTMVCIAWVHGLHVHFPVTPLAWQLFTVQVIPLALGAVLRARAPRFTARASVPLSRVANLSMLALVVLLTIKLGPILLTLDAATWLALLGFSSFALFVGHQLGGPAPETRIAVAICSANRNLGMAVLMGTLMGGSLLSERGKEAQSLIMCFALVNFLASTLYAVIARRRHIETSKEALVSESEPTPAA